MSSNMASMLRKSITDVVFALRVLMEEFAVVMDRLTVESAL